MFGHVTTIIQKYIETYPLKKELKFTFQCLSIYNSQTKFGRTLKPGLVIITKLMFNEIGTRLSIDPQKLINLGKNKF